MEGWTFVQDPVAAKSAGGAAPLSRTISSPPALSRNPGGAVGAIQKKKKPAVTKWKFSGARSKVHKVGVHYDKHSSYMGNWKGDAPKTPPRELPGTGHFTLSVSSDAALKPRGPRQRSQPPPRRSRAHSIAVTAPDAPPAQAEQIHPTNSQPFYRVQAEAPPTFTEQDELALEALFSSQGGAPMENLPGFDKDGPEALQRSYSLDSSLHSEVQHPPYHIAPAHPRFQPQRQRVGAHQGGPAPTKRLRQLSPTNGEGPQPLRATLSSPMNTHRYLGPHDNYPPSPANYYGHESGPETPVAMGPAGHYGSQGPEQAPSNGLEPNPLIRRSSLDPSYSTNARGELRRSGGGMPQLSLLATYGAPEFSLQRRAYDARAPLAGSYYGQQQRDERYYHPGDSLSGGGSWNGQEEPCENERGRRHSYGYSEEAPAGTESQQYHPQQQQVYHAAPASYQGGQQGHLYYDEYFQNSQGVARNEAAPHPDRQGHPHSVQQHDPEAEQLDRLFQ